MILSPERQTPFLILILFSVLFGIAELIKRYLNVDPEYTRKFVHMATGSITLLFPVSFSSHWKVLIVCSIFVILLFVAKKRNLISSINGIKRRSHGSILYPISIYIVYYLSSELDHTFFTYLSFYYTSILVLAFADPLAALIGTKYSIKKLSLGDRSKSIGGTISFLIIAILTLLISFYFFGYEIDISLVLFILTAGIVSSLAELFSKNGWDNLFIPISISICALLYESII